MANSKLIIVEGPQGAGKTTITDYIRRRLPYTNLYRLSGTNDATETGKAKAAEMYYDLLDYMKKLENKSVNLLFDRTFFTEEIYCRMGKKAYSFTDVYNKLEEQFFNLDFDIYYITLFLGDEQEYERRLNRPGKAVFAASKFSLDNSRKQQWEYINLATEIFIKYGDCFNVHLLSIDTSKPIEETYKQLDNILSIDNN
mgnify:CR=1 FL=1